MRINHKQQQLIEELFNKIKEKYPEIVLKNLQSSPEDPDEIWINIIADMDEDREIELRHYSAQLETAIFNDYGYELSIMPENPNSVYA